MMGMNLLLLTHLLLSLAIGIEGFNVNPKKQPTKPLPTLRKDISSFSERELKVTAASSAAELPNFSYASSSSTSATVPSLMTTIKTQVYQYYFGYMRLLQNKPFATSAVSAAVINAIGSVLSQQIMSLVTGKSFRLNLVHVGAFFLTGLIFKGPWYHVWYSWLGRVSGKLAKAETPKNVAIQISLDQTIGVLFFYSTHFYVYELLESIVAMRGKLSTVLNTNTWRF